MGTYKVIQDIEADDKLLGPLSLRQFIYAAIVVAMGFVAFKLGELSIFLVIPFIPPIIFFGLLAAPLGREQSSEVWLLAKIRFFLKPKKRVWNQDGIQELVTITAPKKIEKILSKNLSETEVKSRLEALANTIDSRGWAVRNVNVNMFAQPAYVGGGDSDRLMDASSMVAEVPSYDITASDDILDEQNNPRAQNLDRLINQSAQARKQELVNMMQRGSATAATNGATAQSVAPPANPPPPSTNQQDYWFMNPQAAAQATTQVAAPAPEPTVTPQDEQQLLNQIHANKNKPSSQGHMRVLQPIDDQTATTPPPTQPTPAPTQPTMTSTPDPAILGLANNDDLDVATIARQAHKTADKQKPSDDEVVISLH